jgi:hypothetical protein
LAIVRGAFAQLLTPGLRAALSHGMALVLDLDLAYEEIERQDQMAILHPDTSKIPIWRRRPERLEHPISAWRAWGLGKEADGWYLASIAADCLWEGPVLRAHKRPVDPKYWDAMKEKKNEDPDTYYQEMHDTFEVAGIYAVKTRAQAEEILFTYQVSCYGEVHLWGRVAQFALGYRAEICMIKRLILRRPQVTDLIPHRELMDSSKPGLQELYETRLREVVADLTRRYECEVELV